jgi:hypothetical protein
MTKQDQVTKTHLLVTMCDVLESIYAADDNPPDLAVVSVVRGYMMAIEKLTNEEAAPTKPKQRRARRKKADMVAANAEVA